MRVSKVLMSGIVLCVAVAAMAGQSVVGQWKGKMQMTGTPSKTAPPKQPVSERLRMGNGGGERPNFAEAMKKAVFSLQLKGDKTYVSSSNFGDRQMKVEGSWSAAGNKVTLTPKTRNGKPVEGRGAEPRVFTLSNGGKTLVNERPGRDGMSMKMVYTKG